MSKLAKIERAVEKGKEADLLKLLGDKDRSVRIAAIEGAGKVGKDASCNALIGLLSDGDPEIRMASVKALGQIGDEHTVAHVHHLLGRETDPQMIETIKIALTNLKGKK